MKGNLKLSETRVFQRSRSFGEGKRGGKGRAVLGPFLRFPALCVFLLLGALSAEAADFGLVLTQELKASNEAAGSGTFSWLPVFRPWVSGFGGERFSFYISGLAGFEYAADFEGDSTWRDPAVLPELGRSEVVWLVSPSVYFRLGRQEYADPSGLAASGLVDGLSGNFSALGGRVSAGCYYTGLLYKNQADIIMSGRDLEEYKKPFALDASYFASRRVLAALGWEQLGLGPASSLSLGLLAQFDVNEGEEAFHSQYLSARYRLRLPAGFSLKGTGALGLGENHGDETRAFFAGVLTISWTPPGPWEDQALLEGMYSTPSLDQGLGSFVPVNSLPQGQVFSPAIGGISRIRGAYTLGFRRSLFFTAEGTYFIRTDTVSFMDAREPERLEGDGRFLGGELYGAVQWRPLPDLAVSIGGGVFVPRLGNAFSPETELRWKAAAGLILSL
jgi:hypothetical protein